MCIPRSRPMPHLAISQPPYRLSPRELAEEDEAERMRNEYYATLQAEHDTEAAELDEYAALWDMTDPDPLTLSSS